ncbi:MAG TPA: 30S ribosomal protein S8 [Dictyoglomaceae bacterium]|nr:30S ribosomal protein S8 [Dictyoglomaceae bacterium]HOL38824.1 30S ribosomal protein S8 [Dictyoglomaceae bacterium]HOP94472.1 30S ribosomal protein S8 [Dictyoglomaceae bacterium]HPP15428.1 30S ribosomal protein S8 [Dictyoglomaceae bacterium]HPU43204.1 30S ribosomal protein S8 [Dictyoglomaceae bacterium]
MTVTDPITDMLVRIKNANMRRHSTVDIPHSKVKERIAEILLEEGYIAKYEVIGEIPKKYIRISLKYKGRTPVIQDMVRISKPSRRYYVKKEEIPRVLGGLGIAIVSTSQGIMTDKQAKKLGVGGELICMVW